jgi:ABC-type antimicrobial peptide transport system permease subunit
MLKNYLKVAWRNMLKSKFHSGINILGLSIGIGFTMLIGAYVWSEMQINKKLRNADRQYIIQSNWKDPNMGLNLTTVGPLAKALKEQYPHLVANYYRWDGVTSNVSKGSKVFREGLQIGDSTLLNMYGFKLSQGDVRTALNEPFSLVITEERAVKYFGRTDVVGETLTIESFSGSKHDFEITGVMEKPVDNSVIHLTPENDNQFYIPSVSIEYFGRTLESWNDPYRAAYVELQPGVRPQDLQRPMQDLLKINSVPQLTENMQPYLAPLTDYYLEQNNGLVRKMLYTVSFIALFILLMAIVNFVNISIGKSATRIKEIGVRKVMGSLHRQLILQFLIESMLLVAFATGIGSGIYYLANPFLSEVLGKQIPQLTRFPIFFYLFPVLLILLIGFIAGIYPAFVLAKLKTTDSVKGRLQSVNANIVLRKTLVGFQICIASVVFIGAFITVQQVNLFFSKDIGYNKDYVLSLQVPRDWTPKGVQKMQSIRDQFKNMPEVANVSLCWTVPDGQGSGTDMLYAEGKDSTLAVAHASVIADENYKDVFQLPLAAGRFLQNRADSNRVVINEAAAKANGWNDAREAVGQRLYYVGNFPVTVAGVVKDFHFGSMKGGIVPMVFTHPELNKLYRLFALRIKPGNISGSIEALQKKWASLLPGAAFEYKFMDESLRNLYASEIRLQKASQIALVLALAIVLLGISGLISLSVQKRTKEIGIRKVVGASSYNIISLFLRDFIPVVIIGGIVSVPVAWYIMQGWLNDYAHRISISLLPFLVSIAAIGFIATLLISLQIAKISVENPVKNLRTE